ncbi:unnamed protein product [Closterium sp. NIES-54]
MKPRTQHRCFSRLDDAWRVEFGDEADRPRWVELLRSGVDIFALDYDAILPAMYALSVSAEGDCYLCVPPHQGIEGAALGASLHLPSFSTNLVSTAALQDVMVTTTTPGGQRVSICMCTRTGHHLATSGSTPLHVSPSVAPDPPLAPPPGSPLPATPSWHALLPPCFWSSQLSLWPRVSFPETSPTLRWTVEVGDASVFWVWGSCAFVRDTSADKLSTCAIPCDVTFNKSVPFYRLFPYHTAPLPPPPLFLAPGPPLVDPLPPLGPALLGEFQVDPVEPVEVGVNSGAAGGGVTRGRAFGGSELVVAGPGGIEIACTEPGVAESEGAELGGAEPERAEPGGAEPKGTEPGGTLSTRGPPGALSRREPLSPPQLCEWFSRCTRLRSGGAGAKGSANRGIGAPRAAGAGGATGVGAGGTGARATGGTGARVARGTGAAGPLGARTGGTGAAGAGGAAGVGAGDLGAGDTGAGGAGPGGAGAVGAGSGDTRRLRPYFVPLLQQVLGLLSSTGHTPLLCPPPEQSQPPLQPASPLPAPSPYTEQIGGLTERREPISRPPSPVRAVRTGHRVPRLRPPLVPYTHHMALRPSSVAQSVPLPPPPASSLVDGLDPESDLVRAASPTVTRLLATVVTDPSFQSAAASALIAELVEFAAACRLDYAASLNLTVLRPLGAPREWHDKLRMTLAALGLAPSTAPPWHFLRTDTSLPPFYVLVYVDDLVFATADTEALALVKSELQKRQTCTDLGELCSYLGLQITRDRARRTITLTHSHMVHQVL